MKRLPDWHARLNIALQAVGRQPHSWGDNDCAVGLAAAAVEAVTGTDMAARWRGKYRDLEGALKVLRGERAKTLDELVARYLPPMPLGDMRVGDIAAVPDGSPLGCLLAVCIGERLVVLRPAGRGTVDRSAAHAAFRVGE